MYWGKGGYGKRLMGRKIEKIVEKDKRRKRKKRMIMEIMEKGEKLKMKIRGHWPE